MHILETKTSDQSQSLNVIVKNLFYQRRMDDEDLSNWAIYVNDRRQDNINKSIRPRSKVVVVNKIAPAPKLDIVHECKNLVILNKPYGLPTQKTLKSYEDNLFDQVRRHYCIQKNFPVGIPYVGLHHRLDRDTSGLVLMTKQRSVNKEISDLFKNKKINKEYVAIVEWGRHSPSDKWTVKNNIGRGKHSKHRFYFQVLDKGGDEAITDFEKLESKEGAWHKIKCSPRTGRTHQLRVHLSSQGWPILGDRLYGHKGSARRLMLHAKGLKFHFQGQSFAVKTPEPWDEI